ncbi:MAG: cryptochrome/photolyase family protein, partial [Actinomycetota bacterium]
MNPVHPPRTVWVLGDQLDASLGALAAATPATHRVLMVESSAKLATRRFHVQRAHFVVSAMHHFAGELRAAGWLVDMRRADSLADGFRAHVAEFAPIEVVATEPASIDGAELLRRLAVALVRTNQFLCHPDEFAEWADSRPGRLRMEDFYRHQRLRHDVLVEDGEPVGGTWNLDADNREPPPRDGRSWPAVPPIELDDIDRRIVDSLPDT